MGVIEEGTAKKAILDGIKAAGYKFVAWASLAIAAVGFLVWGHHMFVSGQSLLASLVFSFMSFIVAVPSAIKVFNWTATLHKGWISFDAPMLYALSFLGLGVPPPLPSWGLMIAEGKDYMFFSPWVIMIPGAALFVLVLGINLVGDGLRNLLGTERLR